MLRVLIRRNMSSPPPKLAETTAAKKKTFMELVSEKGMVFVGYYAAAWLSTGAVALGGISLAGPDATLNALHYVGVDQLVDLSSISPQTSNLVSALVVNELLEPIRLPAVLYAVSKHQPKQRSANPNPVLKQWYALKDTSAKYGKFFVLYYSGVWAVTGLACVGTIEYVGADAALSVVRQWVDIDTSRFNPRFVNIGVGLAINELIEPLRFPIGVLTVKPAYDAFQQFKAGK
ncbi:hypothetical protein BASA81_008644 [Batrachochytrium salamandrivorans]|nr:hypothetical protein BASA81_008644 [Batrachochytrium salamandrivorans]